MLSVWMLLIVNGDWSGNKDL